MAKKKGHRAVNVARKREKRNRDRKFKQKQLAVAKQRKLPYERWDEKHLYACISQSGKLLAEPEIADIRFDSEQMRVKMMEVLDNYQNVPLVLNPSVLNIPEPRRFSEPEQACEYFRTEVLLDLVTPDFMLMLEQSLKTCEKRLKSTGNPELGEVAFVTRSLFAASRFEAARTEILVLHPMIQAIGTMTLQGIAEAPDIMPDKRDALRAILSNLVKYEDSEPDPSEPISVFSDSDQDTEQRSVDVAASQETESATDDRGAVETGSASQPEECIKAVRPEELPARALYKNFNGLAIKQNFDAKAAEVSLEAGLARYVLVKETEAQIEFADGENGRYITVTADRLQLHARTEAELAIARAELEAACATQVLYLAKTIEERGEFHATE